MKIKIWTVAITLMLAALARGATNDLTGLLQQGLFEEEANRNLDAAIANYQSLANVFDKNRQIAATAIFRLGECYRKLGKTNEAVVQYQRILKEFSDQPTLVTLSRQNLAGLNASNPSAGSGVSEFAPDLAQQVRQQIQQVITQIAKDQALLETLQAMNAERLRQTLPQLIPDPQLDELEMRLNQASQDLIKLKIEYSADHPKYKNAEEVARDLEKKVNDRITGILNGVTARKESEMKYLDSLRAQLEQEPKSKEELRRAVADETAQLERDQKQLQELSKTLSPEEPRIVDLKRIIEATEADIAQMGAAAGQPPAVAAEGANPVTDEEQTQIRNIQAMIQNSPDLINAGGGGVNGDRTPLQMAAEKGQLVVAKYLLDHGALVDATGGYRATPLSLAADNGHKAMVELLLARGADANGARGPNPLYQAVSRGFVGVVDGLLANKADPNAKTGDNGKGPLHAAAWKGSTNIIQLLLEHGADVNATDSDSNTPLHLAAGQKHPEPARILLAAKANIESKNKAGDTPLHDAASVGGAEMVSFLLDHGAQVDATNNNNDTPLLLAVNDQSAPCVRVLLDHKADPNHVGTFRNWGGIPGKAVSDWTAPPVIFAIELWNNDILKTLLDGGANPEGLPEPAPWSALSSAIDRNNLAAVQLLLAHGANPNRVVYDKYTPLRMVFKDARDKRIIAALLDKGADPNARDFEGNPPIFLTSDPEIGHWLVEHKADVNARLTYGDTALMRANNTNYVKFLLEAGANPDLQETNGNTALHFAAYRAFPDYAALLLEHHANPNIQNNAGYTPLDLAKFGKESGSISQRSIYPNSDSVVSNPVSWENERRISELLVQAGALANLPKRDRIEVRRAENSAATILKDPQGRNQFSLLETIAITYGIISERPEVFSGRAFQGRSAFFRVASLPFPDFKKVVIYRRTENSAKQTTINLNLEDILNSGDCSRDIWLQWGDIVEIPEADHPVSESWQGLYGNVSAALVKCISRQFTIKIKGESTTLDLSPKSASNPANFMLRSALNNSRLIRVSSDLSRVKVTRIDPLTKKTAEWIVDCGSSDYGPDLWLRDGDVIEVPEK